MWRGDNLPALHPSTLTLLLSPSLCTLCPLPERFFSLFSFQSDQSMHFKEGKEKKADHRSGMILHTVSGIALSPTSYVRAVAQSDCLPPPPFASEW